MITTYPKNFADRAIYLYLALLAVVTVIFRRAAMDWYFFVIGITAVYGFFHYASVLPVQWFRYTEKAFEKKLFKTSLLIRAIYVIVIYFFYKAVTGTEFDFEYGDAMFYDNIAKYAAINIREGKFQQAYNLIFFGDYGDVGYPLYLSVIYTIFGRSIIIARMLKALISAWMCVLVYRLASRNFGRETGRLAGILCMLMPNLIFYCGSHTKETEMVFLVILFLERADHMLRLKSLDVLQIVVVACLSFLLFFFRTALAVVLLLSLGVTAVINTTRVVGTVKKMMVIATVFVSCVLLVGTGVYQDISHEWDRRNEQETNFKWRSERGGGNTYFKYATKAMFAPMIFTIPFPTMVDISGQEHTQIAHGGNFVKNIISLFTILALLSLFFTGKWRDHVMILSVLCGYLLVLALSQFVQSERFHMPVLPIELVLVSYGITHLKSGQVRWYNIWLGLMFVAGLGWNMIKLRGRGL